jgi:type II secretion system protein H
VSPRSARCRQSGFSLIEALVVVFIIGLLVVIILVPIGSYYQRQRLDTAANDLRVLLQSAQSEAITQHTPITVSLSADSGGAVKVSLTPRPQRSADSLIVPADMMLRNNRGATTPDSWPSPSFTSGALLMCDPIGRALQPPNGPQMTSVQVISITHSRMWASHDTLTPRIIYDLSVYPVWNVTLAKRNY